MAWHTDHALLGWVLYTVICSITLGQAYLDLKGIGEPILQLAKREAITSCVVVKAGLVAAGQPGGRVSVSR